MIFVPEMKMLYFLIKLNTFLNKGYSNEKLRTDKIETD